MVEMTNAYISDMLSQGVVEPCNGPWASNLVMVVKKNGKRRVCTDFRRLNKMTIKDSYPSPDIKQTLAQLSGKKYFSSFDAQSGCWQIPIEENSRDYTGFVTSTGYYRWVRMPLD